MYFWRRTGSTMWVMMVVVVLLFLCFSPSLSQVGSLVQVLPNEDDPICLGSILSYNCSVTDTLLIWRYTNGEDPVEEKPFHVSDAVPKEEVLGPFEVVLVSNGSINGTSMLTSTATIDNGVMEAVNKKSISCVSPQLNASRTISIAEPTILSANFCNRTIYWSPTPCDANCTVSVDGQEDIGPIPCSVGNVTTIEFIESTKEVIITAVDGLGRAVDVEVQANTSANCTDGKSTVPGPRANISNLTLLSSSSSPCGSSEEYVYKIQDTSLNYTVIESGSGNEVHYSISESAFQLIFDAKCGRSYEVQVNTQVVAAVEAKSCNGSRTCVILLAVFLPVIVLLVIIVFVGMAVYKSHRKKEGKQVHVEESIQLSQISDEDTQSGNTLTQLLSLLHIKERNTAQLLSISSDDHKPLPQPGPGDTGNAKGNCSSMNPNRVENKHLPTKKGDPLVLEEPKERPSDKKQDLQVPATHSTKGCGSRKCAAGSGSSESPAEARRQHPSTNNQGCTSIPEGSCVDLDEGSDHREAKTVQKPEDGRKVVSENAVINPPSGKEVDGKQNRNTPSSKNKVENEDSGPSAMKPVKSSKKLIVDRQMKVYKHGTCPIIHCKISPGGDYIATADLDMCVRVLKYDGGDIVKDFKSKSCVLSLQWVEHNGDDVLLVADHTTMKLFSAEESEALVNFRLRGFNKHSRVLCLGHCTSRSVFALSCLLQKKDSDDHIGQVIIDDHGIEKNKMMCCVKVTSPVSCIVFNSHGTQLITGNMEGKITLFDVQREGDLYTATVCCDWPTSHGIVYNLQYSYDEQYLYSIGKNDNFLLQSKLFISNSPEATLLTSNPPETTSLKIKGGAVSTVQESTDETLPICGQFFCLMLRKNYILTSSRSQGIIYKVKSGKKAVEKVTLPPSDASITCVDWMTSSGVFFTCVLGCTDNSVCVINIIKKNV